MKKSTVVKRLLQKVAPAKWTLKLNNLNARTAWVRKQLESLPEGALLLDAGCGMQQFRHLASHLNYRAQDFAGYTVDEKRTIGAELGGVGAHGKWEQGLLDYVGDIWAIAEANDTFDAILCTEVLEHIPYPERTIAEFSRLLKPGGVLILTAPSNCLRHMDPYYFYSGFSDRFYEKFLPDHGLTIEEVTPVGDYYSWLGVEMARTASTHSIFAKLVLLPAFLYLFSRKKTELSVNTLCMGYHVKAKK